MLFNRKMGVAKPPKAKRLNHLPTQSIISSSSENESDDDDVNQAVPAADHNRKESVEANGGGDNGIAIVCI